MKYLIFLCGPHCSGKTSILKVLEQRGIISQRGSEIGKDLFYQRHLITKQQDANFEFEVTRKELDRDNEYSACEGVIGIETWHPGNLAYAMVRNPDIVSELVELMRTSPLLGKTYGIRLTVSKENIIKRTKTFRQDTEWAADFYSRIDRNLDECLQKLNLTNRIYTVNANNSFEQVINDIIQICKNIEQNET